MFDTHGIVTYLTHLYYSNSHNSITKNVFCHQGGFQGVRGGNSPHTVASATVQKVWFNPNMWLKAEQPTVI